MANAELDMKANLTDLSKIPAKEFEKHFRDWMERDDVARALQAKLRTDLISNFNKTALGRQILAQTTTTTTGGLTHRLTLSPLVLALNTLVAEFLYAQNCHFSLSVFCTEVPFRNTLPDFENSQHFRFTAPEVKEILEAVFGISCYEAACKSRIIKKYEASKHVSLLMLIIRYLLMQKEECVKKIASFKSGAVTEGTQTIEINTGPLQTEGMLPSQDCSEARRSKTEIPKSNMRYLNKYLMILSSKVKEMSEQFEELRSKRNPLPTTRLAKSVRTRRYENLNRSLERIMGQLKHMTHTKRKSKQVVAVVSAVDALSAQFSKCVESFRSVSRELIASNEKHNNQLQTSEPQKPLHSQASVQVDLVCGRAQGGEQKKTVDQKTYTDWVHEMRHTKNGQKFLDRIEASLKKALNRQRELLRKESEEKLRHQKELLKIQYKEKLMEHVSRLPVYDYSKEAHKLNESIGQQLQEFETRHAVLLQKIQHVHEVETEVLPAAAVEKEAPPVAHATTEITEEIVRRVVKEMEPKLKPTDRLSSSRVGETPVYERRTRDPVLKDVVNTQKQLQKMVQSITQQERNVDQIVNDARMRIQELENESNQLELNFRNYLERQRLQADTMREVVSSLSENHKKEKECLKVSENYRAAVRNIKQSSALRKEKERAAGKIKTRNKALKPKDSLIDLANQENKSPNFEYRNAILDAKSKLFKNEHVDQCTNTITIKTGCDDEEHSLSAAEPFYYNRNFGRFESQNDLQSCNAYIGQLNQKPSSLLVNPSQLTLTSISTLPLTSTDLNLNVDSNGLSARSNGVPLETNYTILPYTPQLNTRQSASKRQQCALIRTHSLTTTTDTEPFRTHNSNVLAPFSDATIPTVTDRTITASTVVIAAAANGERNESGVAQLPEGLAKHSESETSTSTNDNGNLGNQSASDLSENSCGSGIAVHKEADATQGAHTTSNANKKNVLLLLSGDESTRAKKKDHKDTEENAFSGKTTITKTPATNSTALIETMERMHRLFTETPKNDTKGRMQQMTQVKIQQKPRLEQEQKIQHTQQHNQNSNSTTKTVGKIDDTARKNEFLTSEEPCTSAKVNASSKTETSESSRKAEVLQSQKSMQQLEQLINTFPTSEPAAGSIAPKRPTSVIEPQYYNITVTNSALAPTISSTTFSICVDDNLKEVASESSIEIASMIEAVDEEIELDELVADVADVEEEDEEEQEEELEPMGDGQVSIVPMPAIAEVSGISSSSSSALSISHYGGGGGGVDPQRLSDSGSDFWE